MKPYKIIELDALDSTNNYARGQVVPVEAVEGTVVLAREQSGGRGNGSNSWESEPGKNLTLSVHFKPQFLEPSKQFFLSMAVSLGVADFVGIYTENVSVKWPNDIYVGKQKIAGILIENIIMGNRLADSIAGIGININQEIFRSDAPNPVSLKQITGEEYDLQSSLEALLGCVFQWYDRLRSIPSEGIRSAYLSRLFRINEWADFKSEGRVFSGRITGISDYGSLQIQTPDLQLLSFAFKEVEFIL